MTLNDAQAKFVSFVMSEVTDEQLTGMTSSDWGDFDYLEDSLQHGGIWTLNDQQARVVRKCLDAYNCTHMKDIVDLF